MLVTRKQHWCLHLLNCNVTYNHAPFGWKEQVAHETADNKVCRHCGLCRSWFLGRGAAAMFSKIFDYLHLHSIQVKADSSKTCIFKTRQLALKRSKWLNGRGRKNVTFWVNCPFDVSSCFLQWIPAKYLPLSYFLSYFFAYLSHFHLSDNQGNFNIRQK